MVFIAFQADGNGRGIAGQPLYEVRNAGYYKATPLTDLQTGDIVCVYEFEDCLYEDDPVVSNDEPAQLWDYDNNEPLVYEEDWIVSYDDLETQPVRSIEDMLGSAEYTTVADDVEDILQGQGSVVNTYNNTGEHPSGQILTSTGVLITESGDC